MKIEIEIPDLEEVYCSSYYEDEEITGKDLKKIIADLAIEKFIDKMYDDYMNNDIQTIIDFQTRDIMKHHRDDIVDKVVNGVSDEILKRKAIVDHMPKKSEIANINKEWEEYFLGLIDKAIAKRFK